MFLSKLKRLAETVGLACFAFLAIYGAFALVRGDLAQAASSASASAPASTHALELGPDGPLATSALTPTVPAYLNYQGNLKDGDGNPLTGYYTVTFRLYAGIADLVSSALWSEQHISVTVREGHFSVLLGDTTPITTGLFSQPDRFIGVTVDPFGEMQPRQRLASVPYAVHADNASRLSTPNGNVLDAVTVINNGNVGIGITNPLAILDVNGNAIVRGNVGIGTITPSVKLEVNGGDISTTGKILWNGGRSGLTADQGGSIELGYSGTGGNTPYIDFHYGVSGTQNYNMRIINSGNGKLAIVDGNVGIGTTNPQAKLDVNGNVNIAGGLTIQGSPAVYQEPVGCGGGLTTAATCRSLACYVYGLGSGYYDCNGINGICYLSSQTCPTTLIGHLVIP